MLATSDGGTNWRLAGPITAPIGGQSTPADAGVDEVAFATDSVGWAYRPALFRTADGGRSWKAATIPGKGHQILALASSDATTYAVVSPCKEFAATCNGKRRPGAQRLAVRQPAVFGGSDSQGKVYRTRDGGQHWSKATI